MVEPKKSSVLLIGQEDALLSCALLFFLPLLFSAKY